VGKAKRAHRDSNISVKNDGTVISDVGTAPLAVSSRRRGSWLLIETARWASAHPNDCPWHREGT